MTRTQIQIIDLISQLPVAERRELFEHIEATGLLKETFYDRMTPEQRSQLDEGAAQADRGQVVDGSAAFDRLAQLFAFKRA